MATRIYKIPFATTGDKEALASTTQPDGKVSLPDGWTSVYELESDNPSYKPVGRKEMNGIFNEVTEAIAELQLQGGIVTWQLIEGGFNKGAIVYGADKQTMWQSTEDANTTDPDSAQASGWVKVIDIATAADIVAGTAGKLVDAAGLVQYMSNRFAIIYPNGGSAASPANITYNNRYVSPNPFPGHYVACQLELYYNSIWSTVAFTQAYSTGTSQGIGAWCGQVDDTIVIHGGNGGLFGTSGGTGNLFNSSTPGGLTAPCRVKVWRID